MNDKFLDYLLNNLDEAEHTELERHLRDHPEARSEFRKFQALLAPLAIDAGEIEPPKGLADRTLARIDSLGTAPRRLPQAPLAHGEGGQVARSWWRRADFVVAACLLVAVAGLLVPAVARLRGPASAATLTACQNNLREFFVGLTIYRDQHNQYPDLGKESPYDVAGMVVPVLTEAGTLPASASIQCPANGPHLSCNLAIKALREMTEGEFLRVAPLLSRCYAYSLGYRDDAGKYHPPGHAPEVVSALVPLMADRPPSEGSVTNSINHGGLGQNVLFLDGSVRFATLRTVGNPDDDIFVNHFRQVAAGVGPQDAVLGYSASRP